MDLSEVPTRGTSRHPWETVRGEFFVRLAARHAPQGDLRVLDVGAGDGWFAERLAERLGPRAGLVCFDAHYDDAHIAAPPPRMVRVREAPEGRFGLIVALDVLEHVEDDRAFLRGLVERNAGPGTVVVLSVPAWPALYSRHDLALRHFRRYRPRDLRGVAEGAGLRIDRGGSLFHTLLPLRAAAALFGGGVNGAQRGPSGLEDVGRPDHDGFELTWDHGRVVTTVVRSLLRADVLLTRARAPLPGLSTWVVGRR
jgi:hypothetical protein